MPTHSPPPARVSIAILSKTFGGAERHAVDLANLLAESGVVVQLITRANAWARTTLSVKAKSRLEVVELGPTFQIFTAHNALKKFRPDVVHSHLGRTTRLISLVAGKYPVVATLHGSYKHKYYKRAKGLICVAPWQVEQVPNGYPVIVVPNFVGIPSTAELNSARMGFRSELQLRGDEIVIGSCGRFTPEKDFPLLISTFSKIKDPRFKLFIAGDGPGREGLESIKCDGKEILGWMQRPFDFLPALDIFVSSSKEESFGLAMLEALACGIPVIATPTAGACYLAEGGGVELVPARGAEEIASAIQRLGEDAKKRSAMSALARSNALRFSAEGVAKRLIEFYQRTIRLHRQGNY